MSANAYKRFPALDISGSESSSDSDDSSRGVNVGTQSLNSDALPSNSSQPIGLARHAAARVQIAGLGFSPVTMAEAVELIVDGLKIGTGGVVVTPNLDIARLSRRDLSLRQLISEADLVTADGAMIVLASRIQRTPVPERVAGSDLTMVLCERLSGSDLGVFLLGGAPGVATKAAARLRSIYPGLRVVGMHSPPMGFEQIPRQCELIKAALEASKPDLVLVGLGCPKQERVISSLRDRLPAAWWIGVGITFSFISGDVRRAPLVMQRLGCEWLWRLIQEPNRLAKRYLVHGIPFAIQVLFRAAVVRVFLKCSKACLDLVEKAQWS